MTTASKVLLVLGATGETGRQIVASALGSTQIIKVVEVGRKASTLPATTPNLHKLTFVPIDYEKLAHSDPAEMDKLSSVKADVVAIALGTTRAAAGSAQKVITLLQRLAPSIVDTSHDSLFESTENTFSQERPPREYLPSTRSSSTSLPERPTAPPSSPTSRAKD